MLARMDRMLEMEATERCMPPKDALKVYLLDFGVQANAYKMRASDERKNGMSEDNFSEKEKSKASERVPSREQEKYRCSIFLRK
jgi:hypothetical protein